jgi:predicted SAM-dependent methyltransferase
MIKNFQKRWYFIAGRIARYFIRKFIKKYTSQKIIKSPILDAGCGYRNNYPEIKLIPYDTLDLHAALNPTYVGDVTDMSMIKDNTYKTVIMTEVLEHVFDYNGALKESYRILKSGGYLITTTPFGVRIHEKDYQKDYWRFTPRTLKKLFENAGFKNVICETAGRKLNPLVVSVQGIK